MVTFPNAKINLGLQILRKRPDGYHDISSLFFPIPLCDALEVIESKKLSFTSSGLPIPGNTDDNLCLKAYHLLKADFELPQVSIHLHKVIPMGAGLGGGSADGAFVLSMLNEKFRLRLTQKQLESYAAQLGSDCPFFIGNQAAIASGRGTELTPHAINLKGHYLVLLFPGVHIGTREAYAGVKPNAAQPTITDGLGAPVDQWKELLKNDFEDSVFPGHPLLPRLKDLLYQTGASYASMTGSGSTIYGIFNTQPVLPALPTGVTFWTGTL